MAWCASAIAWTTPHDVVFANVDNRLTVWVDGTAIFGEGRTYEDEPEVHPEPTADDLLQAIEATAEDDDDQDE